VIVFVATAIAFYPALAWFLTMPEAANAGL